VRIPLRLYDAKYHLKILDELEGERRFMALYRELQETTRLDSEYLGRAIELVRDSLSIMRLHL